MMKRTMLLLILVFLAATCCPAAVWYVDASATGANNGTSWADALTTIQAAVNAAAVHDEIWVKAGTYTDDEVAGVTDSFVFSGNGHAVDILGQEYEMPYNPDPNHRTAHLTVLYLSGPLTAQPPRLSFPNTEDDSPFDERLLELVNNQSVLVFANHPSAGGESGAQWISRGDLCAAAGAGALHAMELNPQVESGDRTKWDYVLANLAGDDPENVLWALRADDSHTPVDVNANGYGFTMGLIASGENRRQAFEQMIRHGNFIILPPGGHTCGMPVYTLNSTGGEAESLEVRVEGIRHGQQEAVEMKFYGCNPGGSHEQQYQLHSASDADFDGIIDATCPLSTGKEFIKYIRVELVWGDGKRAYFQPVRIMDDASWWTGPDGQNNPYPGTSGTVVVFNTHAHTSASDGTCTPATMRRKCFTDFGRLQWAFTPVPQRFAVITDHHMVTLFAEDTHCVVNLTKGVHLYGGFAGTETERDQRNPDLYDDTVIDGQSARRCVYVDASSGWTEQPSIDGFTLSYGRAGNGNGGGLCSISSGITVQNCRFESGEAAFGGGMYNGCALDQNSNPITGSPTILACTFTVNTATTPDNPAENALRYGAGGGVFSDYASLGHCTGCTFQSNTASTHAGRGGGACFDYSGGVQPQECALADCTFYDNEAGCAGADGLVSGGGVSVRKGNLEVKRCLFTNNKITGGWAKGAGIGINYSKESERVVRVLDNVFDHNETFGADSGGGAVYCGDSTVAPEIINNTVVNNIVPSKGGGIWCDDAVAVLRNNVIVSNTSGVCKTANRIPTLTKNDVWGNTAYNYLGVSSAGDIQSADPLFLDAKYGDYRLSASSPCVDQGTDVDAPAIDRDGALRPLDGDVTPGAAWDIGAYERYPLDSLALQTVKRDLQDGSQVSDTDIGPLAVTAVFSSLSPARFYAETLDRSQGIRVDATGDLKVGEVVRVSGTIETETDQYQNPGERYVDATSVTDTTVFRPLEPLSMTTRAVCGGDMGSR